MASSSSSSFKYDVFLSFHGEDTRKTFVDHLYAALDRNNICTFKDDKRLRKGKKISYDLLESIENSRFYIIVFSKNYASSSWCLNELVKIMECHNKMKEQIAFPVFYDVEPSDVRNLRRSIGESIAVHESKNEPEVGKWKEALKDAADLSGWHLAKIADGHEAGAIKKIVHDVSSKLHSVSMEVDEGLVGMEERMLDLESYLEIDSNDVRMIGIKGMGGSGKTTLAGAIFDKICINFEAKSFVQNVREKACGSGLEKLQKQILEDVLKEKDIRVASVHEGKNLLKKKLKDKKVLIVLDDVDHQDQLEKLAGDLNWFMPGSRIIITTRDAKMLKKLEENWIYNINLLSNEEAIRLFSRHAFGRDDPIQEYERQSHEVVRYAAGLPLTLKTLGSLLFGEDKPEWEDVLARLKKIPLKETLKVLELSYTSLEDEHQEIFLDVACFHRHRDVDKAIRVLESCGYHARNGLRVLQQKSLLTIEESFDGSIIRMHDHIVEMGQDIVRREHPGEPNKHSRLWVQEEIEYVLANNLITEEVRCISLTITPNIVLKGLRDMTNLRCLIVNDKISRDHYQHVELVETSQYFPNSLRYLCFRNYPHRSLPETFEADNLVGLELFDSNIKKLWEGGKALKKLKFLSLGNTRLQSLDLMLMPNLERLHLECCLDLLKVSVHNGSVKNLAYLSLLGCPSLKSLSFIQELKLLNVLDINQWKGISKSEIKVEYKFTELRLSDKEILESICSLQHLRTLRLNNDSLLEKLPENVGKLKSLEELDLSGLYSLSDIPYNICKLERLKKLNLSRCTSLVKLPDELGGLGRLQELDLSYLSKLRDIPSIICKLKNLKFLNLSECTSLVKLPDELGGLGCLQDLDLSRLSKLRDIPGSICRLKHLKNLDLSWCTSVEKLPDELGDLECLQELNLSHLSNLRDIPGSICKLKHLKQLILYGCRSLEKLPGKLGDLDCLQELHIQETRITYLPHSLSLLKGLKIYRLEFKDHMLGDDLGLPYDFESNQTLDFQHLRTLELNCHFAELPEALGTLKCLEELHLSDTKDKHLPDSIYMLKHLEVLNLRNCSIADLPEALGQLECLEELDLSDTMVEHLPDSICMLKHLKWLYLSGCDIEEAPEALGQLECLEELDLRDSKVKHLPDSICMLKHLKVLNVTHCRIEEAPEVLGYMECLEELHLGGTDVKHLPESICMLTCLKKLFLEDCVFLEKLPEGVGQLESLELLDLSRCYTIREIPSSICMLKHLKVLNLRNCSMADLPEALGQLKCLEELDLSDTMVEHLPDSICMLKHLKRLYLVRCDIEEAPEALGRLECLEELHLGGTDVKHLPESICMLTCLKKLFLEDCVFLEKLPEGVGQLESLELLDLSRCYTIREIPSSICMLKHLKVLNLRNCSIADLPEALGQLKCLEDLDLSCTKVKHLPDSICMLKHLKWLYLLGCDIEEAPEALGRLECLEELDLSDTKVKHLPDSICMLKFLKLLTVTNCRIKEAPVALGDMECLEELHLGGTDVKHLPESICMLKHLKKLFLKDCVFLEKLPEGVGQLESLEELDLSKCYSIREIPHNICMLKHLKKLKLDSCSCLEKLPENVGQLESLEELDLSRCYNIREIPSSICMLKRLKKLFLEACVFLEKLPDCVGQLESLEEFYLSKCYSIREIPHNICMLKHLKKLKLDSCFCLEKLPEGVGQLESLEELDLSRCYNIREIPSSICMLKHLQNLNLENCRLLEKLPDQIRDLGCLQLLNSWDAGTSTSTTHREVDFLFEKLSGYAGRLEKPWKLEKRLRDLLEREPGEEGHLLQLLEVLYDGSPLTCQRPQSIYVQKFLKMCGFTFYTQNPDEHESVDTDR